MRWNVEVRGKVLESSPVSQTSPSFHMFIKHWTFNGVCIIEKQLIHQNSLHLFTYSANSSLAPSIHNTVKRNVSASPSLEQDATNGSKTEQSSFTYTRGTITKTVLGDKEGLGNCHEKINFGR